MTKPKRIKWFYFFGVVGFVFLLSHLLTDNHSRQATQQPIQWMGPTFTAQQFAPMGPAQPVDSTTQATRERLLGKNPTDPNWVRFWWVGVSSFIVSLNGHLFLLDAWEIVGFHTHYLPITRDDLVALQPEAIFVGHGHFDHAGDVGYVAGNTKALVIGSQSVCDTARYHANAEQLSKNFPCLVLGSQKEPPVANLQSVKVWSDLPSVTVLHHLHSAANKADLIKGEKPLFYSPTFKPFIEYFNTDWKKYKRFFASTQDDGGLGEPDGGTWAYHFRIKDFSFLWHDSTGPIDVSTPNGQATQDALGQLPECVDVQLHAIVSFSLFTSGFRDPLLYIQAANPKVALPTHHDAWAPIIGGGAKAYEEQWKKAISSLKNPPDVDYLTDPQDYLKPKQFKVVDPRWSQIRPGGKC